MHCDNINRKTGMFAFAAIVLMMVASLPMADADTSYDKDYGQFYSYTLQFVFDGSDAESIEWDFGDGTKSNEWNPAHTYSAKGVYYVTQTTTNSYQGGSTTVEVYKVEIMGFPVISFDTHGGPSVPEIQQTAYNVVASKPADPVWAGHTFGGWFTDAGCTIPYDWGSKVIQSMTLHAKWTDDFPAIVTYTVTFDQNGGSIPVPDQTVNDGSVFTIPGYDGTRDGHTFGGWRIGNTVYQPGQSITVTSDLSLIAQWNEVPSEPEGPETPGTDTPGSDNPGDSDGDSDQDGDSEKDPADSGKDLSGMIEDALGPNGVKVVIGLLIVVLAMIVYAAYRRMH